MNNLNSINNINDINSINNMKNIVNIEMHGDGQYKIISPMGQLLLEGYLTGDKKQIDLSEFPPSMYYLYIDSQIIKLIKSN